ncbi:hypothetical protein [Baekduia alba]|uniref:hypothetical protein n=1 Tax=Baekduia alba TaxID=2997333 RepID=UPI002341E0BF|nr:hypothetical protein [Baekduia alba]
MIRTPLLLILAACATLALAACGSSDENGDGSGKNGDDKAYDGALKFAKCMREHGVDVPDPERGSDGRITMKAGGPGKGPAPKSNTFGPDDPKFKVASQSCQKYMVAGGGKAPSPAEQAKRNDAFIGYARCMRSKGIDFPDPQISGNGVKMMLGRGVRPDSPKFKAADKACHPLMAAVEPKGAQQANGPVGGTGPAQ